jgi:hypothetical protein
MHIKLHFLFSTKALELESLFKAITTSLIDAFAMSIVPLEEMPSCS